MFDFSFRWINSIESLNIEGCDLIDDNFFWNLFSSLNGSMNLFEETIEEKHRCLPEEISLETTYQDRFAFCQQCSNSSPKHFKQFQLKILNLSGCYRLTDSGIK